MFNPQPYYQTMCFFYLRTYFTDKATDVSNTIPNDAEADRYCNQYTNTPLNPSALTPPLCLNINQPHSHSPSDQHLHYVRRTNTHSDAIGHCHRYSDCRQFSSLQSTLITPAVCLTAAAVLRGMRRTVSVCRLESMRALLRLTVADRGIAIF